MPSVPQAPIAGADTTNKVTSGLARAGIFLIPSQCLDGQATTSDPLACPSGENGGDAVIDLDVSDFLKLPSAGGKLPKFHVWTGPRYRFNPGSGKATYDDPAPCNARFMVEVSTDPQFPAALTVKSPWKPVKRTPSQTSVAQCYDTWMPTAKDWKRLAKQLNALPSRVKRIYYRAWTDDLAGGNVRVSTQPGAGLWTVPPPSAIVTPDGHAYY